jgi:hypothetical protein
MAGGYVPSGGAVDCGLISPVFQESCPNILVLNGGSIWHRQILIDGIRRTSRRYFLTVGKRNFPNDAYGCARSGRIECDRYFLPGPECIPGPTFSGHRADVAGFKSPFDDITAGILHVHVNQHMGIAPSQFCYSALQYGLFVPIIRRTPSVMRETWYGDDQ